MIITEPTRLCLYCGWPWDERKQLCTRKGCFGALGDDLSMFHLPEKQRRRQKIPRKGRPKKGDACLVTLDECGRPLREKTRVEERFFALHGRWP